MDLMGILLGRHCALMITLSTIQPTKYRIQPLLLRRHLTHS